MNAVTGQFLNQSFQGLRQSLAEKAQREHQQAMLDREIEQDRVRQQYQQGQLANQSAAQQATAENRAAQLDEAKRVHNGQMSHWSGMLANQDAAQQQKAQTEITGKMKEAVAQITKLPKEQQMEVAKQVIVGYSDPDHDTVNRFVYDDPSFKILRAVANGKLDMTPAAKPITEIPSNLQKEVGFRSGLRKALAESPDDTELAAQLQDAEAYRKPQPAPKPSMSESSDIKLLNGELEMKRSEYNSKDVAPDVKKRALERIRAIEREILMKSTAIDERGIGLFGGRS